MKRWLITTTSDADLAEVRGVIEAAGGTVDDLPPVPLGSAELVVEVDGPDDLAASIRDAPSIVKVSPDTPKHKYG